MNRYRYRTLFIVRLVSTTNEERDAERKASWSQASWLNPIHVNYTKLNPEWRAFTDGVYEPPVGWQIKSHQLINDGISLLLEQEIIESTYR